MRVVARAATAASARARRRAVRDNCGGCCNGTTCVTGTDSIACGKQGEAVHELRGHRQDVYPAGPAQRSAPVRRPVTCNAGNCPGCCVGNSCVVATTPAACGKGGAGLQGLQSERDVHLRRVHAAAPNCSPANCAGCCIGADICAVGNQNTACGVDRRPVHQLRRARSRSVRAAACQVPACGPGNCAGCCSGNTCVLGTQDTACGQNGAQCNDCTPGNRGLHGAPVHAEVRTCQLRRLLHARQRVRARLHQRLVRLGRRGLYELRGKPARRATRSSTPRVCANQQITCPAPYPSCPAGTTTPVTPSLQGVCDDAADLDAIRAACAGGPDTGDVHRGVPGPRRDERGVRDVPHAVRRAVQRSSAASISARRRSSMPTCNHATGCAVDCADTSCSQCAAGIEDQCRNQVNGGGGQCRTYRPEDGLRPSAARARRSSAAPAPTEQLRRLAPRGGRPLLRQRTLTERPRVES